MRSILILTGIFILAGCRNGCQKTEVPGSGDTTAIAPTPKDNNPMTADSIIPPSLKDTAGMPEYNKDSLRMAIAFQRAANQLCGVLKNKDAEGYLKYTPPAVLKVFKGQTSLYLAKLREGFAAEAGTTDRIVAGPMKRVSAALDDQGYSHGWYCLMPVRRFVTTNGKRVMEMQWFGGQSLDEGRTCYFLNVTNIERNKILSLIPDLRFVLDLEASNAPAPMEELP